MNIKRAIEISNECGTDTPGTLFSIPAKLTPHVVIWALRCLAGAYERQKVIIEKLKSEKGGAE